MIWAPISPYHALGQDQKPESIQTNRLRACYCSFCPHPASSRNIIATHSSSQSSQFAVVGLENVNPARWMGRRGRTVKEEKEERGRKKIRRNASVRPAGRI